MEQETLDDFYNRKHLTVPPDFNNGIGHFNVFKLDEYLKSSMPVRYARRDFYKISLIKGKNRYHYADKSIEIEGNTLMFFTPLVPYTLELLTPDTSGYFCIFTEEFLQEGFRGNLNELPMFTVGGKYSYELSKEQEESIAVLYEKMLTEINSNYTFKYNLLRSYLNEMMHIALKTEPAEKLYEHPNANSRITSIFKELLERQFPIETSKQRFSMRSASDFADSLAVHVNHLNRAIKNTTGKTTTTLIGERLLAESKALLKHTDWNIAEISNSLGFEEAAHFNNFFKKHTTLTPSRYRKQ
ncbi:MAG: AraC family transcriptional regulator [Flavobacterium sp. MedPE-SWcel]|uniref:helix-turn-helix domain-containing protein n=1 Tax=uncultured Flavobacterium sp. TaxID=165435 RepID=UPI0009188664|nr:AraC family transcriptional regulator [uncultured Flavobacterium sp.]OIQ15788.1 MAG: AraC family transcriptional regulator [Flavobacterium sp. MedPE-SWcel]